MDWSIEEINIILLNNINTAYLKKNLKEYLTGMISISGIRFRNFVDNEN